MVNLKTRPSHLAPLTSHPVRGPRPSYLVLRTSPLVSLCALCASVVNPVTAQQPATRTPHSAIQAPSSPPVRNPGVSTLAPRTSTVPAPPSFYASHGQSYTRVLANLASDSFFSPIPVAQLFSNPLQWGPFHLYPRANYSLTYATGLNRTPGRPEETVHHTISPGITWQAKRVTIDYSPSLVYYTKGSFQDSVNHSASASSAFGYGDWNFSLSHQYSKGSSVLAETATQTAHESHSSALAANYRYSDKTSFSFSLSQSIQETSEFNSSQTWSTMEWINYQLTSKTSIGAGIGGGYTIQELGSDMTYQQVQGRVGWSPGPKLNVDLNGGIDIRQFVSPSGRGQQLNPTFGVAGSYQVFDTTSVRLSANRAVTPSLFSGQISHTTSISAAVNQRLFGRLALGVTADYRLSNNESTEELGTVSRSDTTKSVAAVLSTRFLKKGSVSAAYSHSVHDSNEEGFSYDSDQYTLSLGYRF